MAGSAIIQAAELRAFDDMLESDVQCVVALWARFQFHLETHNLSLKMFRGLMGLELGLGSRGSETAAQESRRFSRVSNCRAFLEAGHAVSITRFIGYLSRVRVDLIRHDAHAVDATTHEAASFPFTRPKSSDPRPPAP